MSEAVSELESLASSLVKLGGKSSGGSDAVEEEKDSQPMTLFSKPRQILALFFSPIRFRRAPEELTAATSREPDVGVVSDLIPATGEQLQEQTNRSRRRLIMTWIGICLFLFFAFDVVAPILVRPRTRVNLKSLQQWPSNLAIVSANIVTAQLTLICVWGVLIRGTFLRRLPWTALLLLTICSAFSGGIGLICFVGGFNLKWSYSREMFSYFLVGFAGLVAFNFVCLKLSAAFFRWQISDHSIASTKMQVNRSLSIRRITGVSLGILALSVVVIVLSVLMPEGWTGDSALEISLRYFAICYPFCVIAPLVTLPSIWITLGVNKIGILCKGLVLLGYCSIMATLEFYLAGLDPRANFETATWAVSGNLFLCVIVFSMCLLLRGLGYRLYSRRPRQTATVLAATIAFVGVAVLVGYALGLPSV